MASRLRRNRGACPMPFRKSATSATPHASTTAKPKRLRIQRTTVTSRGAEAQENDMRPFLHARCGHEQDEDVSIHCAHVFARIRKPKSRLAADPVWQLHFYFVGTRSFSSSSQLRTTFRW